MWINDLNHWKFWKCACFHEGLGKRLKNQHFNGIMKHIKKFEMRGMNKMEKQMEKIVSTCEIKRICISGI